MHEGRVAQHGHGLALALFRQGLVEAVDRADGGPHTFAGLNGIQRLVGGQGVAADVAQHRDLVLGQGVEQAAVGTSGAQHGGTAGDVLPQAHPGLAGLAQLFGHETLGELALQRQHVLAQHVQTQGPAVVLDHGVQLLQDQDLVHLGGKVQDLLLGQGVHEAQL